MRVLNRLMGLILGLALFGAGGFMALETILAATGNRFVVIPGKNWLRVLRHTPWSANTVVVVLALVAAGGFVLAAAELRRWRRPRTPVTIPGAVGDWSLVRRSVEAHLARRVRSETPAERPRLKITLAGQRWRVRVVAREPAPIAHDPLPGPGGDPIGAKRPALAASVEQVARQALARLGAPESSRVRVRVLPARKVPSDQLAQEQVAT